MEVTPENPAGLPRVWVPPKEETEQAGVRWADLFDNWGAIKLDLLEVFHVDLDRDDHRAAISWHWLVFHIGGLLEDPPHAFGPDGRPLPANRLQWALMKE